MKKIVSLVLAVLLGLSMACSAMAAGITVTEGTKNVLETIYGWNQFWPYYPIYPLDPPEDEVDPGFTMPSDNSIFWIGNANCPVENCGKLCNLYRFPTALGSRTMAYCSAHGLKDVNLTTEDTTTPDTTKTYKVSYISTKGGSIRLGDSIFNAVEVAGGTDMTVTITPDYGYEIGAVYLNGYYIGAESELQLNDIYHNYTIRVVYNAIDLTRTYTVKAETVGSGTIQAELNGKKIGAISSLTGTYADKVTLRFVPDEGNYSLKNVTINGVNMGAITAYEVGRMRADLTVSAAFVWNNPFSDIADEHLAAVEYVSEIDVMGSPNAHFGKDKFLGNNKVTVKALACYFAELADVDSKLDSVADRVAWAEANGLTAKDEVLTGKATWTRTCDMLNVFVRLLEKNGSVTFKALESADTAYAVASAMDVVTEASYKADSEITRYDVAEICYAVAQLEVK